MRFASFGCTVFLLISPCSTFALQVPSSPSSDGLDLLSRVEKHYADAKSYRIEMTEERTISGDYTRQWTKTQLIAAEASGGRLYFEGHSDTGSAIKASDGKTIWKYRAEQHRYTAKPASSTNSIAPEPIAMSEMAVIAAQRLRQNLAQTAKGFKSAQLLPASTIVVDKKPIECEVVHVANTDQSRPQNYDFERTLWIDKKQETILKVEEHAHIASANTRVQMKSDTTTVYTNTEIDNDLPASFFEFKPPSDARLIVNFPSAMEDGFGNSLAGDPIPPLKFKSADGTITPIESFKGKPVIIDFWATWCGPCVASMPKLADIYDKGKAKGLVLLSVDQDEDASKAVEFLAKKGYNWPNFHDGDGAIEKLMGSSGIPRTVLIDDAGEIVYDGAGSDDKRLRTHLAQLGPEFKEFEPKPSQSAPCIASK